MPEINVAMGDNDVSVEVAAVGYTDEAVKSLLSAGVPVINTDELLVGNNPPLVSSQKITSGEKSSTYEFLVSVGTSSGFLPSVNELSRGNMTAVFRYMAEVKVADPSADGSIRVRVYTGDGSPVMLHPVVRTNSTEYATLDSGWQPLGQKMSTFDKPFRVELWGKTSNKQYEVTVRNGTFLYGSGSL